MPFESIDGIDVTNRDHLLRIRLDRPEQRNAMTPDQINHISKLCAAAEEDDDVRVVLLTGTGDSFCAGADLSGVDLSAHGGQIPPVSMGRNLFLSLLELSKPLVGAINGVAAGGGLGLALCCDIRLGSDDARFATSFSRIGLTANDAVAWLLPRIVGIAKAIELIAIGKPIDATEAERIGLISYRYPNAEFDDAGRRVRRRAARRAAGRPAVLEAARASTGSTARTASTCSRRSTRRWPTVRSPTTTSKRASPRSRRSERPSSAATSCSRSGRTTDPGRAGCARRRASPARTRRRARAATARVTSSALVTEGWAYGLSPMPTRTWRPRPAAARSSDSACPASIIVYGTMVHSRSRSGDSCER